MFGVYHVEYREILKMPPRQSVRYNKAENLDLLAQHAAGFSMEEIAEWHQRSVNGVSLQIARLLAGESPIDPGIDHRDRSVKTIAKRKRLQSVMNTKQNRCCSCGTTKGLFKDGYYGWRCRSDGCVPL